VKSTSGIEETLENNTWKIYPNPVNNHTLFIQNQSNSVADKATVFLFDGMGRIVLRTTITTNEKNEIHLPEELSAGIYSLQILQSNNVTSGKIILQ
jgi:hypothetical protein